VELEAAILRGDAEAAPALVERVMEAGTAPQAVIGDVLTPAIQRLGDAYGRGEVFLPQLMVAAEAMKAAVARVKERLPEGADASAGRVAFATVKGDIHSIGKDICVSLLQSQGIEVEDLGVDVPVERVLSAASQADVVCLSALMTTTLPAMQATVDAIRSELGVPVFVGGAVVTREWADSIGAGYSADAPGCVEAVQKALRG
jgi:5-methyltetrahydrofolate--homocysteine methyltransferase